MSSNTSRRTGPGDGNRRAIMRFVQEYGHREGHSPSQREIADQVGLAISTVNYHLEILERDGILRRSPGRSSSPTAPPCSPTPTPSRCR